MKFWLGGVGAALAVALGACFSPGEAPPCTLSCAQSAECPGEQQCSAGLCVMPGPAACSADPDADAGPTGGPAFSADDFDDGELDAGRWSWTASDDTARVVERYGLVHVQPSIFAKAEAFVATDRALDLRGRWVELEVFGVTRAGATSSLEIVAGPEDWFGLRVKDDQIELVEEVGGEEPVVIGLAKYDPREHRRWRLGVVPGGGQVEVTLVAADSRTTSSTHPITTDTSQAALRFGVRSIDSSYVGPGFRVGSLNTVDTGTDAVPDCALTCTDASDCLTGTCRYGFCVADPATECLLGSAHELETEFTDLGGWTVYHTPPTNPGSISASGALVIEPVDVAGHVSGITSTGLYDLRDSHLTGEVTKVTSDSAGIECFVGVLPEGSTGESLITIGKHGPQGLARMIRDGLGVGQATYEIPDGVRFWRLAEHAGTVTFELSADGESWQEVAALETPFAVARVMVGLGAGSGAASQGDRGSFQVEAINGQPHADR